MPAPNFAEVKAASCRECAHRRLFSFEHYFYWFATFVRLNLFQSALTNLRLMMTMLRKFGVRG